MSQSNNVKVSQAIWDAGIMNAVNTVLGLGPQRILVNDQKAVASKDATFMQKRSVEVIFIRLDGWSLGVSADLIEIAEAMWPNEWAGVVFSTKRRTYAVGYTEWIVKGGQPGWAKGGSSRLEQIDNLRRHDGDWRTSS